MIFSWRQLMESPFINYSKAMLNWNLNQFSLKNLVHKKLEALLISAFHNVPDYQNIMKKIVYNPDKHYSGVSDLQYFQLVSKELRGNNSAMFLAKGLNMNHYPGC